MLVSCSIARAHLRSCAGRLLTSSGCSLESTIGIHVSLEAQAAGLDASEIGESAYTQTTQQVSSSQTSTAITTHTEKHARLPLRLQLTRSNALWIGLGCNSNRYSSLRINRLLCLVHVQSQQTIADASVSSTVISSIVVARTTNRRWLYFVCIYYDMPSSTIRDSTTMAVFLSVSLCVCNTCTACLNTVWFAMLLREYDSINTIVVSRAVW
jgi:hypothetical protein